MVEATNKKPGSDGQEMYWIIDCEELCWSPGIAREERKKTIVVQCMMTNEHYEIEKEYAIQVHPSCLDGVSDLLALGDFNEGALLHTIRERHSKQQIYTSIGSPILIAVNPFQRLNIFTTTTAYKYRQFATQLRAGAVSQSDRPEPHLFMVAEDTYQDLLMDGKNQSIIITGESGAGKTESTKIILSYLAKAAQGFSGPEEDLLYKKPTSAQIQAAGQQQNSSIEKQVLDSNPLLEAFGNAKTFKNNNSSRFGKFIQVNFDVTGNLHSASIVNYLLEKSRIIFQHGIERNFHIFYQLLKSAHLEKSEQAPLMRKFIQKYQLLPLEDYHYVNQSDVISIDDVDDEAEFEMTLQCMKNVHFTDPEIAQILDVVVAILNIGNIDFGLLKDDNVGPAAQSKDHVQDACRFLQIDMNMLIKSLTTKQQKIANEVIETPLTLDQAYQERDSLCKHLYSSVFSWIVQKINAAISVSGKNAPQKSSKKTNLQFIGLLDIFGFEIFTKNSFEQLCINYANEKLQQQFNQHMFTLEQEEYVNEGIEWSNIQFKDNQHTIDLIEDPRSVSVFKLLDEQFMLQASGSDKKFFDNMNMMLSSARSFKKPTKLGAQQFIICHYAGDVAYDIDGFVEKNKDTVGKLITETMANSKQVIIKAIYQPLYQAAEAAAGASSLKGNSLSNQFRTQLQQLIVTIKKSQPRYVRCIKPNSKFSSQLFDSYDVRKQLRCAGMLEAIRIRKAGYSIRIHFDEFIRRYRPCLKANAKAYDKSRDASIAVMDILKKAQPKLKSKFQIGFTKMFLKEETRTGLEQVLNAAVKEQVVCIQSAIRGKLARNLAKRLRKANTKLTKFIYSRILRQRWRALVMQVCEQVKSVAKRIQSFWRRLRMHRKLIIEVNNRIAFKHRMAYEKEQERLRKIHEEQLARKQATQPDDGSQQETDGTSREFVSSSDRDVEAQQEGVQSESNPRQASDDQRRHRSDAKDMYSNRLEKNLQNIQNAFTDSAKITQLQEELNKERQMRENLETEMSELQSESNEKDKKIRELTIRLEQTRKYRGGASTNVSDVIGGQNNFLTENSSEMSMFKNLTTNFGNSLFTPDGQFKDEEEMDEKNEIIEQLKSQIELMESERTNLKQQIDTLQEDNESLNQKNKKWIAKVDEEIEKNSVKITQLNQQIKTLQDENYKLEVTSRLDQSLQQSEEELASIAQQLTEKQDHIDHLESRLFSVSEEHSTQTKELESQIRNLSKKINQMEVDHIKAAEEFEKTQEQLIMKDEQVLQLETELEILQQNENSQHYEISKQSKDMRKQIDKMEVTQKRLEDEKVRLDEQATEQRTKIKQLVEENDALQDKLIELKGQQAERGYDNNEDKDGHNTSQMSLPEFERNKMKGAIDELNTRCRTLRDQNKRLDAENNFFHQSTTVFLTLKKVMEAEKQLCYQLAQIGNQKPASDRATMQQREQQKESLENGITKCRENINVLEQKLKKVMMRIKPQSQPNQEEKKEQVHHGHSKSSNSISPSKKERDFARGVSMEDPFSSNDQM